MRLRNQKGQMTIEAVLLLVIFVAMFKMVQQSIKDKNFLSNMVSGPWTYVQGMIQNGVWAPGDAGAATHPNIFGRRASPEPI
jgi:hypothetical protein